MLLAFLRRRNSPQAPNKNSRYEINNFGKNLGLVLDPNRGRDADRADLKTILLETLTSMRRAGADIIITYYTPQILEWIADDQKKG